MIEALSVLGAVLLFIAAVFEVLLIAGLPLGYLSQDKLE